jgi:hypothetical protein
MDIGRLATPRQFGMAPIDPISVAEQLTDRWCQLVECTTTCNPGSCGSACPTATACPHDVCSAGEPLASSCSSSAASVCASDPFCCTGAWDQLCIDETRACPVCVTIKRGFVGAVVDADLFSASPDTNFGGLSTLDAGRDTTMSGAQIQGLLRYDLGVVPAGATINSATATLSTIGSWDGALVRAHKSLAAWSEATVTWNSFAGAYDPTTASTFSDSTGSSTLTADFTSLVASWVATPSSSNFGVLLERDLTGTTSVASSEASDPATYPSMTVCYLPPL